jgi:hypothetical protein
VIVAKEPTWISARVPGYTPAVTEQIASELIKLGLPGIIILVLMLTAYKLYNGKHDAEQKRITEVEAVQKARVEDQKAFQAQFLEVVRLTTAAVTSGTNASDAMKEAFAEMRELFRESIEDRRNSPRR